MRTWLKEFREFKKMTHEQTATKCGISRTFYTLIENGNRRPSVKIAKAIADELGFDWTLFYTEVTPESNNRVAI